MSAPVGWRVYDAMGRDVGACSLAAGAASMACGTPHSPGLVRIRDHGFARAWHADAVERERAWMLGRRAAMAGHSSMSIAGMDDACILGYAPPAGAAQLALENSEVRK